MYRSFDDKAYLCPATSTGMQSARSQNVYQTSDEGAARKFRKYDFPVSMVSWKPPTFCYMEKTVALVYKKEVIKTSQQQSIVFLKPKYFVGSSRSVWSSHLMEIRQSHPYLHEITDPSHSNRFSHEFRTILLKVLDNISYFFDQTNDEDIMLVTMKNDCAFSDYEIKKLKVLIDRIKGVNSMIEECKSNFGNEEIKCVTTLLQLLSLVMTKAEVLQSSLKSKSMCGLQLVEEFHDVLKHGLECLMYVNGLQLPKQKPYVVDLTDSGLGVGITNHEFCYRIAQEIRIADYQYYIRHHLAPADSSHNEVERIQSYVGDATCDGSYINWEHRKKLSSSDEKEVRTFELGLLKILENMKQNECNSMHLKYVKRLLY